MRPLTLTFRGLRSYRSEQTIDFTDVDLAAIIGDTGAGKSSITEAICFALYGASTWDSRSPASLIADGGDGTLCVELTFRARGQTWKITRTITRGSQPSAHSLICLDDGRRYDSATSVRDQIRNLVGVDHQTFIKTVILPQGRFQELLHTPDSGRTAILKSILNLDQLDDVRRQAKHWHDQLQLPLQKLQARRELLPDDPAAALQEAADRHTEAVTQRTRIQETQRAVRQLLHQRQRSREEAENLRQEIRRLDRQIPARAAERYQQLIDLDEPLSRSLIETAKQLARSEKNRRRLADELTDADKQGSGPTATAVALNVLESALDLLPKLQADQQRHIDQRADLQNDVRHLQQRKSGHQQFVDATTEARKDVAAKDDAPQRAIDRHSRHRELLALARSCTAALTLATKHRDDARADLRKLQQQAISASAEAHEAEKHRVEADLLWDDATHREAAARASERSRPGDPCPICARALPDDFSPRSAPSIERAKKARSTAATAARKADSAAATARAKLTAGESTLEDKETLLQEALREHHDATASVNDAFGPVDLTLDDQTLLEPFSRAIEQANSELRQAQAGLTTAERDEGRDRTEIEVLEANLDQRGRHLEQSKKQMAEQGDQLLKSLTRIPAGYGVATPSDLGHLRADHLEHALRLAQERSDTLEQTALEVQTASTLVDELRAQHEDLTQKMREQIERPAERLAHEIDRLASHSELLSNEYGWPTPTLTRPQPQTLQTDARWAQRVLAATDTVVSCAEQITDGLQTVAEHTETTITQRLSALDAASADELDDRLQAVNGSVALTERDEKTAKKQVPECADLDHRIAQAAPLVASLGDLSALLADGKFPKAVVQRRQLVLLAIASELLQSMTAHRFAFADDFRIVDSQTGQPREAKTLSGGETFLASLALALALVELASRSGGRIEALFLDEGFGSLDANTLSEALDVLTGQASGGRLVTVISHMSAVAESFDHVLMVTETPAGSTAHWAGRDERDQIVADAVTSRLLN